MKGEKETYERGKRGLANWEKRPKETYDRGKRGL
jgi:hypothetical protein